jgi:ketosteroid isomerase-like protein
MDVVIVVVVAIVKAVGKQDVKKVWHGCSATFR